MENDITILGPAEAKAMIATARQRGYATVVASGTFLGAYDLPSGESIDHYLNFGWMDKYILAPKGYRAPLSIPREQEW